MAFKVFKFGGASVKDANAIRNVARVIQFTGYQNVLIVISAMGKTTNALEEVLKLYFDQNDYRAKIDEIKNQHLHIVLDLMPDNEEFISLLNQEFEDLKNLLSKNKSPNYSFVYDQVVSFGELISTKIVNAFFNSIQIDSVWLDARDYIKTDNSYREGKVDWDSTCSNLQNLEPTQQLFITQGFIGSTENYFTTTLGREGSDYTGAIIAYCLNAESLTIWKDVPGVLNADPRYFEQTTQLNFISYGEAIELAYYGASVIHPKTLQPLQQKNIPLLVKSFDNPELPGTVIQKGPALQPLIPCFIIKKDQFVITIKTLNFSFIDELVLKDVFEKLYSLNIKINLIQISAISLSLCVEDKYNNINQIQSLLSDNFSVEIAENCNLLTVRHDDGNRMANLTQNQKVLIKQTGIDTLQVVIKS